METIVDAVSLHSLKKAAYARLTREGGPLPNYTMYDYYLEVSLGLFGSFEGC